MAASARRPSWRGAPQLNQLDSVTAIRNGWQLTLETANGGTEVQAEVLIDASGRAATIGKQLGARRRHHDPLVCLWLYGHDQHSAVDSRSQIEAVEHGGWYTASLPGQRRVLAFHTDSDLPNPAIARALRSPAALLEARKRYDQNICATRCCGLCCRCRHRDHRRAFGNTATRVG